MKKNPFDVNQNLRTNLFFKRRRMIQNQGMTSNNTIKVPNRQVMIAQPEKIKDAINEVNSSFRRI